MTDAAYTVRQQLEGELRAAMKNRDLVTIKALRAVLNVVDQAGAIDVPEPVDPAERAVASLPRSSAAAEIPRRQLGAREVEELVRREAEERREAAEVYRELGRSRDVERLLAEASVIERCLEPR